MLIIMRYTFDILKSCYLIDTNTQLIHLNIDRHVIYISFQRKFINYQNNIHTYVYRYILSTKNLLDAQIIHF